jgi:hypothetical protein
MADDGSGRAARLLPLLFLVAVSLIACRTADPIPSGAQQVHVAVTRASVTINPKTVRAGDIYVVLDGPELHVGFAMSVPNASAAPGPLSDADLDRLARGDAQGLGLSSFGVGCDAAQRAEDRGKIGYCGNVRRQPLSAGKYAFYIGSPGADGIHSIAVLDVLP